MHIYNRLYRLCCIACHLWIMMVFWKFLSRNPSAASTIWINDRQFSSGFFLILLFLWGYSWHHVLEASKERKGRTAVNKSTNYYPPLQICHLSPNWNHTHAKPFKRGRLVWVLECSSLNSTTTTIPPCFFGGVGVYCRLI